MVRASKPNLCLLKPSFINTIDNLESERCKEVKM